MDKLEEENVVTEETKLKHKWRKIMETQSEKNTIEKGEEVEGIM